MPNSVSTHNKGKVVLPAFMELMDQDRREDQYAYIHNRKYHTV